MIAVKGLMAGVVAAAVVRAGHVHEPAAMCKAGQHVVQACISRRCNVRAPTWWGAHREEAKMHAARGPGHVLEGTLLGLPVEGLGSVQRHLQQVARAQWPPVKRLSLAPAAVNSAVALKQVYAMHWLGTLGLHSCRHPLKLKQ